MAAPFLNLWQNECEILKWDEAFDKAFTMLKKLLWTAIILKYPEFDHNILSPHRCEWICNWQNINIKGTSNVL